MSDDESFIVLGTTPTPSMDDFIADESFRVPSSSNGRTEQNILEISTQTENNNFSLLQNSMVGEAAEHASLKKSLTKSLNANKDDNNKENASIPTDKTVKSNGYSGNFILGEIPQDTSVMSQYSSLMTSSKGAPNDVAMQNLIVEHGQLKDNLLRTNLAMRKQFSSIQKWQSDVRQSMEVQNKLGKEYQETIATLESENAAFKKEMEQQTNKYRVDMEVASTKNASYQNDLKTMGETIDKLRKEMKEKTEIYEIELEDARTTNTEMTKKLSEHTSVIQNMSSEIQKLEAEKDAFIFVQQNAPHASDGLMNFVSTEDHDAAVKKMSDEISSLTAQVLEFEDMRKIYTDELDCLKVNLTSAEELLAKSRFDICQIRDTNSQFEEKIVDYVKQIKTLSEDVDVLNAQLEIYKTDFEAERTARQELAGEKERVLTDLKLLQKRNAQLITEAQSSFNPSSPRARSSASSDSPAREQTPEQEYVHTRFACPLCSNLFQDIKTLQTHAEDCAGLP